MDLNEALKWRYATKKMNGTSIPEAKLDYIIEAARLAPSSSGLQPYQLFVISSSDIKQKIMPIAYNQSQIIDASHLLVFASWESYSPKKMEAVFNRIAEERNLPINAMENYKTSLWERYKDLGEEWHANHTAKQAYLSFGMAIAAAAVQKVDATPMEGFDQSALDELLGLHSLGLKSTVVLALGYREESKDWLAGQKKVRTPLSQFVTTLK